MNSPIELGGNRDAADGVQFAIAAIDGEGSSVIAKCREERGRNLGPCNW